MKTTIIATLIILSTFSTVAAQDTKQVPSKPAGMTCSDVGGGIQVCVIRDSQGHEITCTNVNGICIQ